MKLALTALALLLGAVASAPAHAQSLTPDQIQAIIASPDRTAGDRTTDQRRKPDQMIAFFGVRPGMNALDISAAGGYTTELLARAIGPTGTVYGQMAPRDPNRAPPAPAVPEGNANPTATPAAPTAAPAAPPPVRRTSAESLALRAETMKAAGTKAAAIVPVEQKFESPVPADLANGKLDLVTLIFNYHDFGFMGVDRAAMNKAVFAALKPGGVYVIADHAGRPGTGISESGTLHRIEEAFLKNEVETAGFKLQAVGDFLRNPNDPKDRNTPEPAQPKDQFVLKFVKP